MRLHLTLYPFGSITFSKLTLFQFLYFLFNFHGSLLPHSVSQRYYITTYTLSLSTTFLSFFYIFLSFFSTSHDTLAPVVEIIYKTHKNLSTIFGKFLINKKKPDESSDLHFINFLFFQSFVKLNICCL